MRQLARAPTFSCREVAATPFRAWSLGFSLTPSRALHRLTTAAGGTARLVMHLVPRQDEVSDTSVQLTCQSHRRCFEHFEPNVADQHNDDRYRQRSWKSQ